MAAAPGGPSSALKGPDSRARGAALRSPGLSDARTGKSPERARPMPTRRLRLGGRMAMSSHCHAPLGNVVNDFVNTLGGGSAIGQCAKVRSAIGADLRQRLNPGGSFCGIACGDFATTVRPRVVYEGDHDGTTDTTQKKSFELVFVVPSCASVVNWDSPLL